ncbi:MAG TPA: TolC family protein, partial [Lacipirellulaceae bacterium]|nr:TolC family protein [Lacipirellulaceae bacterium]
MSGASLWTVLVLFVSGCTASHYQRAADREAYRIIQDANRHVFGRTNVFTIDTRYSARRPQDIPPLEIIEDRTQTNRRVLNLTEALDLAVQNSREYQAQKEQLYLTALSLTGARYEFTPIFLANSTGQIEGSPDGSDVGSLRSRIGVSQLFKTGGTLSVALANDLLRYFAGRPPGVSRNSAIDLISVDLAQPLLQGFGQNDPRVESLTQAERNVVYAIRSFSYYQQQFAVNVVSDYFSLLSRKQEVRNNYTNYLRRVDLTKFTEARAVDRVRAADVADARTAELGARIGYINSVALYQNQLDAFKLRLGLPITETVFLGDADLRQLERVELVPVNLKSDVAFALAVGKNLELLNAVDRFEDSKRKVRLAADQLKPRLNLFANASLESEAPSDYAHFDPDKVRYQVGLSLDNLVDKLPARNVYRATLVSFESQLRSLVSGLDNLRDRIDRGLRTVEQDRQNYLNLEAALEVAARRLEMNQMLLENGRVQVRDLREAQDALILAQNQVTDSVVNYLGARLDVLREVGVLTTGIEQFWLKDPLAKGGP